MFVKSENMYFCGMQSEFTTAYKPYEEELTYFVNNFTEAGENFGNQKRNTLKIFKLNGESINIKSFKVPNFINKIAYRYFRKSKAQRSFEYASILLKKGIKTPMPIGYFQKKSGLFFGKSYYLCAHLQYDLTYRDLIHDPKFPNRYEILKQFTRFTYQLHEKGIEFLDHSPGNTLIVVNETNNYDFYLVDLNRMKFHESLDYETRIKNFSRLTPDKNMVSAMSAEYARLIGRDFHDVFKDMWSETEAFQEKHYRKKRIKRRLKFWQ